jgi:hypothetical protein
MGGLYVIGTNASLRIDQQLRGWAGDLGHRSLSAATWADSRVSAPCGTIEFADQQLRIQDQQRLLHDLPTHL